MCQLYRVSGRVQGVFFRDSTRDVAERLGVAGHAINLPDGCVEVLACGPPDRLLQLEEFLRAGPRMASVEKVERSAVDCTKPTSFTIG